MKVFFVNHFNYNLDSELMNPREEAVSSIPSQTVPGMTLSLRDLVERYTRGLDVQMFQPVYDGDDDFMPPNLDKMTEIERIDLSRDIGEAIFEHRSKPKAREAGVQLEIPDASEPVSSEP